MFRHSQNGMGYLAAIAQAAPMSGIVLVSPLTIISEEDHWRPFRWTLVAPMRYNEGAKGPWHQRPLSGWSIHDVSRACLDRRLW